MFNGKFAPKVLLIEWEKGKLNGIGGKIENGETALQAIVREAKEETAIVTDETDWKYFCLMQGKNWKIYVHKCFLSEDILSKWQMTTDKRPFYLYVSQVYEYQNVSNLQWLMEMAVDDNDGEDFFTTVNY